MVYVIAPLLLISGDELSEKVVFELRVGTEACYVEDE